MDELIRELANTIGITADAIVGHYARWFVVASIAWLLAGAAVVVLAWKADYSMFDEEKMFRFWFRFAAVLFAALVFACNVPDLIAPTGMSIHQLLTDIRG